MMLQKSGNNSRYTIILISKNYLRLNVTVPPFFFVSPIKSFKYCTFCVPVSGWPGAPRVPGEPTFPMPAMHLPEPEASSLFLQMIHNTYTLLMSKLVQLIGSMA